MRLFFHYVVVGFSNMYLIGGSDGGDAILIDPGIMDIELISMIESKHYVIRHVLITHAHEAHTGGLKTLQKIYPSKVYAVHPHVCDIETVRIHDGMVLDCSGISVTVNEIPGHSSDSVAYRIDQMLFTGDIMGAGEIGSTPNSYAKALLIKGIREKILCHEDDQIFPGHGPPTTVRAEYAFNPYLIES